MKTNTYFDEMRRVSRAYNEKKMAHDDLKQEIIEKYGWDSKELDVWRQEDYAMEYPFGMGAIKAYRAWEESEGEIEVSDICWEEDIPEFVHTFRMAGIESFVVTDQSTALMKSLHAFASVGCIMEGLCILEKRDRWDNSIKQVPGIRFRVQ